MSHLKYSLESVAGVIGYSFGNPSLVEVVEDHLLFTIMGFIVSPTETMVFAIGDGVCVLNGSKYAIAFKNNAPLYLSYSLLPWHKEEIQFKVLNKIPTSDLQSLIVGTDGLCDFPSEESIDQFVRHDKYFKNPDAIRRKLFLLNQTKYEIDWENKVFNANNGCLADDTTLIALRRKTV
jgi:hypothetical protein